MSFSARLVKIFFGEKALGTITRLALSTSTHVTVKEQITEYLNLIEKLPHLSYLDKEKISALRTLLDSADLAEDIKLEILQRYKLYQSYSATLGFRFEDLIETFNSYFNLLVRITAVISTVQELESLGTKIQSTDPVHVNTVIKHFETLITQTHETLTRTKSDLLDYLILSPNEYEQAVKQISQYLQYHYTFHKLGIQFLDNNVGGLEASTVHLIAGASNHGKSIFMLNLFRQLIINNDFSPSDCVIWITLEDSIYRLIRRLISIAGNVETFSVKHFYNTLAGKLHDDANPEFDSTKLETEIAKCIERYILVPLSHDASSHIPKLILKHSDEFSLSTTDIRRFLDLLAAKGLHPRAVFIDYLDLILPAGQEAGNLRDYDAQGLVVQQLRAIATQYNIPIITVTQNQRIAEDPTVELTNRIVGDSHKKIRYSDYIYMIRQHTHMPNSQDVHDALRVKQLPSDEQSAIIKNLSDGTFIPLELVITKAKDSKRGTRTFLLFDTRTLRIYESAQEALHTNVHKLPTDDTSDTSSSTSLIDVSDTMHVM